MLKIQDLLEYDIWATETQIAALNDLATEEFKHEPGGELSSIRQEAVHLISVVDRYRARLVGDPVPEVSPSDFDSPNSVYLYAQEVAKRVRLMMASLSETSLAESIRHETKRGVYVATREETLVHAVNHSTYHRGQIAALLKVLGREPVDTDFIIWVKQRSGSDQAR